MRERGGRRGPAPVARGAAVGGNGSGGHWGNQHLHLRALFFSSFHLAHLTEQVSRRHPRCNMHRSFLFPGWVVFRSRVHRSLAPVRRPVDGLLCLPAVVGSAAGHVGAQRPASLFPVPGACPGWTRRAAESLAVCTAAAHFTSPPAARASSFLHVLSTRGIFRFFDSGQPSGYEVASRRGFDWCSLVAKDGSPIHVLISHWCVSFGEMSAKAFWSRAGCFCY